MIVYLGMPKCASTWLWNNLRQNLNYTGDKEPHTLVESGLLNNEILDFSTNNWSMDSSTVRNIDSKVSNYIYIIRDPVDLATSYFKQVGLQEESFDDFVTSLIKTKLLCFGDIIERWHNLVDKNKILIYNYEADIANNNEKFILDLYQKLKLEKPDQSKIIKGKIFETPNKPKLKCSDHLTDILKTQLVKFKQITQG